MKQGWEVKKLGEIGKPSMCKRILKNQTSSTGEIPFYKIGTFGKKPDSFISKKIYDEFFDNMTAENFSELAKEVMGKQGEVE